MKWVVAYDVTEDRKRGKLADLLLDHGDRVQKSVFEMDLSEEELRRVLKKAETYLDAGDSLRAYPLCRSCEGRIRIEGRTEPKPLKGYRIV